MTPPTPQEPPAGPPTRKALRSLLPVLAAHRAMTARTCAAALVDQAALVALVTLAAHTVGTAVIDGRPPSTATAALLLALVAVRALATWREMDLSHDLAYRVLALLRVRVFDGIARSAPARIAGRRSGDLASTALGDVEALEFFYAHALAQLLATGTVFTASAALLGTREPWLLALVLPAAALLLALPVLDGRGRAARGARTRAALADLSAETVETVDGLRELLAFGALHRRRARLRAYGRRLARAQRAEQSWEAGAAALRDLLVVAAVIGVVAVAGHSAVEGRLHGAWTPAAMALALGALAPVADAAASLGQAGSLRAAAARVRAAAEAPAGAPEPSTPRPLPEGPLGLRLRGVRFGYGSTPVLDGVDLTVRPGETVALVGASGAGKSTCAHLLARYWDPQEGAVTLVPEDGRPPVALRDLADAELRSAVAVVGQEAPLFHGTLAENLLLAAPDAPPDVLDRAVRACGVDVLAAGLPDGLGTAVGERGATLSGGQRARIALARALVAAPRVLVLDETTAHLDHTGDAELAAALAATAPGRATLVIAHRPATVRRADRVAVLEDGRIVEEGTWQELASAGGALTRLLSREATPTA
ncbi:MULTISPECIES: ABC transporter ATP-binding protein [unclassified Streptomyces]|uniref:ABC transporter ATP-binding protein n=1 Tax=unclassified Streptomyces TaxID=2593676 RepID=UPI000366D806|nr:ABC transporter ATP-binding protein [Streptomyces sp. LaPpAH-202]MYW60115.1 ATP-binding cassette domain-containing protein [Streptomyces sp. SID8370]MYW86414.1 ATP-binding cassette domain-containing protein [Streptomyces sp. SID8371]